MAVMKVIELMSESSKSWEDAAQKAVDKANKSLKGIRSVWIQDFSATVDAKGKLETYRVNCKVSFEVKDK
jgi:flavin-binding protein dodecin